MYLIINEDGAIRKSIWVYGDDLENCDGGYLEIIDISNPEKSTSYYHGKWDDVLNIGEDY